MDLQKIKETLSEFRKAEHDYNLTSGNPEEKRRRLAINAAMDFEKLRVVIANDPELSTTANGKRMVELVGPGFLECPITQRYHFPGFTLTKEYENYKHELLLRVHELLLNSPDEKKALLKGGEKASESLDWRNSFKKKYPSCKDLPPKIKVTYGEITSGGAKKTHVKWLNFLNWCMGASVTHDELYEIMFYEVANKGGWCQKDAAAFCSGDQSNLRKVWKKMK